MKIKKTPISIILIIIWMIIASINILFKLFDLERFSLNVQIMGKLLTSIDYIIDAIILVLFVIFIVLFLLRIKKTDKHFFYFIIFLMAGSIFSFLITLFNVDQILLLIELSKTLSKEIYILGTMLGLIFNLIIYYLMIFFVRKNKLYFKN